jgi:large subunit ribosomal protein L23
MSRTRAGALQNMTPEEARRTIIKPYMTEKTFNLIEGESKIVFIVDLHATKKQIKAAIKTLYEMESEDVNTMRSIREPKPDGTPSGVAGPESWNGSSRAEVLWKMGRFLGAVML